MVNRITILQGDITKCKVDVIVNAANTSLLGGGGVDGAIHRAAGPELLADCRKVIARQGSCQVGEVVYTTAGLLPAKFVIHTVGPVWNAGIKNEEVLLSSCYAKSLALAASLNCESIAFPSISTGIYRFPKDLAAEIAISTILANLETFPTISQVYLVAFDEQNFQFLKEALDQ